MSLSADRLTQTRSGHQTRSFSVPMKGGALCYQGGLVFLTAGYAHGGAPVSDDICVGVAQATVDNTAGSSGDVSVFVRTGAAKLANDGSNPVVAADLGSVVYAASDFEVSYVAGAAGVVVGVVDELDVDGVWVFTGSEAAIVPPATGGYEDVALTASPGPTLSATAVVSYLETTETVAAVKPDGLYVGQMWFADQSVAADTPVGTVTGHFALAVGTAKGTLALGTAVGLIGTFVWTGAAWRLIGALGGTGSGLS